jgi:hypothetical protein
MEKIKTFVKLYSQNHEERGYTTPTSGRATTTSQTPTLKDNSKKFQYSTFAGRLVQMLPLQKLCILANGWIKKK